MIRWSNLNAFLIWLSNTDNICDKERTRTEYFFSVLQPYFHTIILHDKLQKRLSSNYSPYHPPTAVYSIVSLPILPIPPATPAHRTVVVRPKIPVSHAHELIETMCNVTSAKRWLSKPIPDPAQKLNPDPKPIPEKNSCDSHKKESSVEREK